MGVDHRMTTTAKAPDTTQTPQPDDPAVRPWPRGARTRRRLLAPGWPLTLLFVPFPLWWALGLSHFIFFPFAIAMAVELLRRRPVYTPKGFGFWLLFLAVVVAGVALLWLQPPGTVASPSGFRELEPYLFHLAWYLSITVVALYTLNMPERDLPTIRVMRLLALMFLYTVGGGFAGLLLPHVSFPSLLELIAPIHRQGFIYALVHPSLVSPSEFLGYEQPRPSAPFTYPNAWGNNLGMFLPFFVATWLGKDAGWRRPFGVPVLVLSTVPIVYSLNRGLWIGLLVTLVALAVKFVTMGRTRRLPVIAAVLAVGAVIFIASPLYSTVVLRVNTPHSNERRGIVASEVVKKTAVLSPLLGYGETRAVQGSFESIAGGETPTCHQCAAPPLGTQGFMWRLIFTTGVLGTLLFLAFTFVQLLTFAPMRDPVALAGCAALLMSFIFSFVYDSLEAPLFTVMIAVGLLSRRFVRDSQLAPTAPPGSPL
jgi:hypothetical protein